MYMVSVFWYLHCKPTRLFFLRASFSKPFLFGLPLLQQALALQPIKISIGEELIRGFVRFEIDSRQVTQLRQGCQLVVQDVDPVGLGLGLGDGW